MYSDGPTDEAKIDSTQYESELLGSNDLGDVFVHGPFGNSNSEIKIVYLIGMHPLESKVHRALFDTLSNKKDLKFCYYIYNVNVKNISGETEGRMEGQLLAQEFALPCIINEKYDLFLDIHSNRGTNGPGNYEITNFVFAPGFDDRSSKFMNKIIDELEDVEYYVPEYRTSPPFITEPASKAGIPTIVYECCSYESLEITYKLADKLVDCIDNFSIF